MNLYVSNLDFKTNEDDLRNLFSEFGQVTSVKIITDRETGRSRGFGFIEMDDNGGNTALNKLNGKEVSGRSLSVSIAREKSNSFSSKKW